jgi:hypothetical protein
MSAMKGLPPRLPPRLQRLLPPVVVLLVAVAFFSPFLFQGRIFLAADTLKQFYPWKSAAPPGFAPHNALITDPVNANFPALYNAQLKSGGLAQWDPYMFTGVPATEVTAMMGAPGRSSPLKLLLHRLLSVTAASMILNFLYICLMGGTMYAYLREIRLGWRGALFGAVAFMCNGYLMVWLEFESVGASAALVPLVLLVMERYCGPRPFLAASAGGIVLGLVGLSGMLQYVMYSWLLFGAYALFLGARQWREKGPRGALLPLLCFAISAVAGGLISSGGLLPAQELIASSTRIARAFTFRGLFDTLGRLPMRWLVTLAFPDFFGSPPLRFNVIPAVPGQEYMNYNELCLYLGVPTLFALLFGLASLRRAHAAFFLGATVCVTAMLAGTVLYYPLFALVPGMDRMNPLRMIFLLTLTAPVAAAFGIQALEEAGGRARRLLTGACVALAAAILLLGLFASRPGLAEWFNREMLSQAPSQRAGYLAFLSRLRSIGSPLIGKPMLLTAAAATLSLLLLWVARLRAAAYALLLGLLAYDLISFGWGYNTFVKPAEIYPLTPSIEFLRQQPGPFRVVADGNREFLTNGFVPYGIQDVGGYSSFYPGRVGTILSYAEFGPAALSGARFDRWISFRNIGSPLMNLMNVKYVLTAPGISAGAPRYRRVFSGDMTIYENTAALERATVVTRHRTIADPGAALSTLASPEFDPRQEVVLEEDPGGAFLGDPARAAVAAGARVERYLPDEVTVVASLPQRGWLVLADTWYRGWEATVDGQSAPIVRANYAFRAVPLRAGTHRVVFSFRPAAVPRGKALMALGFLLSAAGIGYFARRRAEPGGAGSGDGSRA